MLDKWLIALNFLDQDYMAEIFQDGLSTHIHTLSPSTNTHLYQKSIVHLQKLTVSSKLKAASNRGRKQLFAPVQSSFS